MSYMPLPLVLAIVGCAASPSPAGVAGHEIECSAVSASALIGQVATAENQRIALLLSRSELLRVLHPGDGATADYQTGRINLILDSHGIITELRCG